MTESPLLIDGARPARAELDPQVAESGAQHELCEAWSIWCATRRFYGPPPIGTGILGKLTSKSRPAAPGAGDAACGPELMALHRAITGQVDERGNIPLDRKVFELHYRWRVRNIKAAAHELGINRAHWYRLLKAFRARVCAGSAQILGDELAAADRLPHAKKHKPPAEND